MASHGNVHDIIIFVITTSRSILIVKRREKTKPSGFWIIRKETIRIWYTPNDQDAIDAKFLIVDMIFPISTNPLIETCQRNATMEEK
jgi:hypothetical protein